METSASFRSAYSPWLVCLLVSSLVLFRLDGTLRCLRKCLSRSNGDALRSIKNNKSNTHPALARTTPYLLQFHQSRRYPPTVLTCVTLCRCQCCCCVLVHPMILFLLCRPGSGCPQHSVRDGLFRSRLEHGERRAHARETQVRDLTLTCLNSQLLLSGRLRRSDVHMRLSHYGNIA